MKTISLLMCSFSLLLVSAEPNKDPLGKPKVWKALISDPFDSALWVIYLDKPWISWSPYDYSYQRDLQNAVVQLSEQEDQHITTQLTQKQDEFWTVEKEDNQDFQISQKAFEESQKLEIVEYEKSFKIYLRETKALTEKLEKNISYNFFLIEDIYQREFRKVKIPYKSYLETHPDGKFDKVQWIKNKKQMLQKYRTKHLKK